MLGHGSVVSGELRMSSRDIYDISLVSPFTYTRSAKLDNVLEVSGVILTEGVFTDMHGTTFYVSPQVLYDSAPSFVGVSFVYPHTDQKDDITKVCGTVTEVTPGRGKLPHSDKEVALIRYKGFVHKPNIVADIEGNVLNAHSIEAKLFASYNAHLGVNQAMKLVGEAVAFTTGEKAACKDCLIDEHRLSQSVKLETKKILGGRKNLSTPNGDSGNTLLEPPTTKTPEEIVAEIVKLMKQHPDNSNPKTWETLTDVEKTNVIDAYLEKRGLKAVKPDQVKEPEKVGLDASVLDTIAHSLKTAGLKDDAIKAVLTGLNANAKLDKFEPLMKTMDENTKLKKDLDEIKQAKLEAELDELVKEITEIDKTFDPKVFMDKMEDIELKIDMCKRYKVRMETLTKPVKLEAVATDVQIQNVEKISMEAFGQTPDQMLRDIVPAHLLPKEGD